ncbi:gamma-butyrobetaine dioxygenase isoform X2 [Strongylocentrotus purpuratus]|uniref:TauD/TfdA-like domain-containing protein n=1 Tax=Strongylocentrotus purpuratus TaxID=7668 RepID=A0A7M7T140_STRPU|nr:gamma-butyrobetaine dioxygenase isoform X2 [Strongylocentrotus purpuratus]
MAKGEIKRTEVKNASLLDNGQLLSVEWADSHHGIFPTDWLRGHRFDQSQPDPIEGNRPHLWGHDVMSTPHFRMFEFDEVMESDDALYDWLKMLFNLGIAVLKNAPIEQCQQYSLQKRLGYDSPAPSSSGILNQAKLHMKSYHPVYTAASLQLHNDLSYYTQAKGFQLFHCKQQVTGGGGDSLLADGFKVAEDFRCQNPESFRILTRIPWEYKLAIDKNYHVARREVIRLDTDEEVCQITINDICRAAMLRIPLQDVKKAYVALKEFTNMLYHPDNLVRYKLEAGDILAFHNHRILHGRLGFSMKADTQRHLETCYSDWEIVSGRMRNLKKQRLRKSQGENQK